MSRMLAELDAVSHAWFNAIVAVTWQWSLVAVVFAATAWFLRRSSPALRYWLWQLFALKLLVMPLWSVAVPWPRFADLPHETARVAPARETTLAISSPWDEAPRHDVERAADSPDHVAAEPAATTVAAAQVSWRTWLLMGWLVGVGLQVGLIIRQRVRLANLLRQMTPGDPEWLARVRRLAESLGLRSLPRVALIELDCSPFVCGTWRPVLVVPRRFQRSLEPERLDQVILHELAHVKRRDLVWNWIPELARLGYFFNPLVYWVGDRVRLERELACDQLAMLHSGGTAAIYAETLLAVVTQSSEPAVLRGATVLAGDPGCQQSSGDAR